MPRDKGGNAPPFLAFLVGALVVAVIVLGVFTINGVRIPGESPMHFAVDANGPGAQPQKPR